VTPAEFAGKTAYVVGGSLGIGLAVATRLVALGAHVVVFARRPEPLERAVARLRVQARSAEQRIAGQPLDAADPEQVAAVMGEAVARFGAPDVLINCAGRAYPDHFESITHAQLCDTMRSNLGTCWSVVSALAPHMRARGGYIVNTASVAGLIGVFGYTDYCASKFAIVGFSEALRSELLPHGIAVSVLCPPDTATPGFDTENRTKPEETRAISAGATLLGPDDVAQALLVGMRRRRFLIVPGASARLVVLMKRFFPSVVMRVMDRTVRRVARGRTGRP
jgi:3-dehydrosphinganine reductase